MCAASTALDDVYPTEEMHPTAVVEVQLRALMANDGRLFWRFLSPEAKRATGVPVTRRWRPHLKWPSYGSLPLTAPLVGARRFELLGALNMSEDAYQCRARVWPQGGERECSGDLVPAPPVEYIFRLARQPLERPVCYDDDPMQQGISTGPPFAGCWLTDAIRKDDRWGRGRGDGDRTPAAPGGGARELASTV